MRKQQAGFTRAENIAVLLVLFLLAATCVKVLRTAREYREQVERTTALSGWLATNNPEMNFTAKVGDTCGCDHGKTVPYELELKDKISDKFTPGLIFVIEQPKERPLQKGQIVTLRLVGDKIEVENP